MNKPLNRMIAIWLSACLIAGVIPAETWAIPQPLSVRSTRFDREALAATPISAIRSAYNRALFSRWTIGLRTYPSAVQLRLDPDAVRREPAGFVLIGLVVLGVAGIAARLWWSGVNPMALFTTLGTGAVLGTVFNEMPRDKIARMELEIHALLTKRDGTPADWEKALALSDELHAYALTRPLNYWYRVVMDVAYQHGTAFQLLGRLQEAKDVLRAGIEESTAQSMLITQRLAAWELLAEIEASTGSKQAAIDLYQIVATFCDRLLANREPPEHQKIVWQELMAIRSTRHADHAKYVDFVRRTRANALDQSDRLRGVTKPIPVPPAPQVNPLKELRDRIERLETLAELDRLDAQIQSLPADTEQRGLQLLSLSRRILFLDNAQEREEAVRLTDALEEASETEPIALDLRLSIWRTVIRIRLQQQRHTDTLELLSRARDFARMTLQKKIRKEFRLPNRECQDIEKGKMTLALRNEVLNFIQWTVGEEQRAKAERIAHERQERERAAEARLNTFLGDDPLGQSLRVVLGSPDAVEFWKSNPELKDRAVLMKSLLPASSHRPGLDAILHSAADSGHRSFSVLQNLISMLPDSAVPDTIIRQITQGIKCDPAQLSDAALEEMTLDLFVGTEAKIQVSLAGLTSKIKQRTGATLDVVVSRAEGGVKLGDVYQAIWDALSAQDSLRPYLYDAKGQTRPFVLTVNRNEYYQPGWSSQVVPTGSEFGFAQPSTKALQSLNGSPNGPRHWDRGLRGAGLVMDILGSPASAIRALHREVIQHPLSGRSAPPNAFRGARTTRGTIRETNPKAPEEVPGNGSAIDLLGVLNGAPLELLTQIKIQTYYRIFILAKRAEAKQPMNLKSWQITFEEQFPESGEEALGAISNLVRNFYSAKPNTPRKSQDTIDAPKRRDPPEHSIRFKQSDFPILAYRTFKEPAEDFINRATGEEILAVIPDVALRDFLVSHRPFLSYDRMFDEVRQWARLQRSQPGPLYMEHRLQEAWTLGQLITTDDEKIRPIARHYLDVAVALRVPYKEIASNLGIAVITLSRYANGSLDTPFPKLERLRKTLVSKLAKSRFRSSALSRKRPGNQQRRPRPAQDPLTSDPRKTSMDTPRSPIDELVARADLAERIGHYLEGKSYDTWVESDAGPLAMNWLARTQQQADTLGRTDISQHVQSLTPSLTPLEAGKAFLQLAELLWDVSRSEQKPEATKVPETSPPPVSDKDRFKASVRETIEERRRALPGKSKLPVAPVLASVFLRVLRYDPDLTLNIKDLQEMTACTESAIRKSLVGIVGAGILEELQPEGPKEVLRYRPSPSPLWAKMANGQMIAQLPKTRTPPLRDASSLQGLYDITTILNPFFWLAGVMVLMSTWQRSGQNPTSEESPEVMEAIHTVRSYFQAQTDRWESHAALMRTLIQSTRSQTAFYEFRPFLVQSNQDILKSMSAMLLFGDRFPDAINILQKAHPEAIVQLSQQNALLESLRIQHDMILQTWGVDPRDHLFNPMALSHRTEWRHGGAERLLQLIQRIHAQAALITNLLNDLFPPADGAENKSPLKDMPSALGSFAKGLNRIHDITIFWNPFWVFSMVGGLIRNVKASYGDAMARKTRWVLSAA